jgi:hypothetical protein
MAKLKLTADPKFSAKVEIPVPGGSPVLVSFTFIHRTKKALEEFMATRTGKTDVECVLEMCSGWEMDEVFDAENVDLLIENYGGAALAIYRTYLDELIRARLGN